MGSRQSERVGPDCKSGGLCLSRCESYFPHQVSKRSSVWQNACFGSKRSQVRVLSLRPSLGDQLSWQSATFATLRQQVRSLYPPPTKKLDTCIYLCYNYIIEGKNDNGFNRSDGWFLNFFWSRSSHRNLGMDCNVLINNTIGENKNVYDGKDSRRRN